MSSAIQLSVGNSNKVQTYKRTERKVFLELLTELVIYLFPGGNRLHSKQLLRGVCDGGHFGSEKGEKQVRTMVFSRVPDKQRGVPSRRSSRAAVDTNEGQDGGNLRPESGSVSNFLGLQL